MRNSEGPVLPGTKGIILLNVSITITKLVMKNIIALIQPLAKIQPFRNFYICPNCVTAPMQCNHFFTLKKQKTKQQTEEKQEKF